jgi:hypothetical protein
MSPHVWHAELAPRYHMIRRGNEDVIKEKDKATRNIIKLSDSLLNEYKKLEDKIDPKTYKYYLFKLEENNWHLRVMREWHLVWLKAANMLYYPNQSNYTPEDIENHFQRLLELNREKERKLTMQWHGKDIDIQRGEYLDIEGYIEMFEVYCQCELISQLN